MIKYDVAISFSGEQRDYARELSAYLVKQHVKVFYDEYELAMIWGKNLPEELHRIYSEMALHCVMLISNSYAQNVYTNVERRAAIQKAIRTKADYLLPIVFDDTILPGISIDTCHIKADDHSVETIGNLILEKIGGKRVISTMPAYDIQYAIFLKQLLLEKYRARVHGDEISFNYGIVPDEWKEEVYSEVLSIIGYLQMYQFINSKYAAWEGDVFEYEGFITDRWKERL